MGSQLNFYTGCLSLVLLAISINAELHCFKKVHSNNDVRRGPICRGFIYKSKSSGLGRPFRSRKGCCRRGGAGYTEGPLVRLGKKGVRYSCTLCTDLYPKVSVTPPPAANPSFISTFGLVTESITEDHRTGWSDWGPWDACSTTCMIGTKKRKRQCYSNCVGEESEETRQCVVTHDCPVNGGWGPWNEWIGCSATCGGGQMRRSRRCNDPVPQYNGLDCPGNGTESEQCAQDPCPVDGNWSEWTVSECSRTCGRGVIARSRSCDNPPPQHGGRNCEGKMLEEQRCPNLPKCPIDGGWILWSSWSSCPVTCGTGSKVRTRRCIAPEPQNGGANCSGNSTEHGTCYHRNPCPVDGGWTNWQPWGECIAFPCTGDTGLQTRRRTCKNPLPRFNGRLCTGNNTQTQECANNQHCPEHGGWCPWTEYSECRESNTGGFQIKTRECGCPTPKHGGDPCNGTDFETENCLTEEEIRYRCRNRQMRNDGDDYESSGYLEDDEDC